MRFRLHERVLLLLLTVLAPPYHSAAAQEIPSEQLVRAAMVFNFLKFTDLPAESPAGNSSIRLCVDVEDALQEEALIRLAGRKVGGHWLTVLNIATRPATSGCDVLYVDSRERWNSISEHRGLSIGTYPGFAQDGGIIEITVRNDGTQFAVNLAESRRAGIHFSPQLLLLARQIHE